MSSPRSGRAPSAPPGPVLIRSSNMLIHFDMLRIVRSSQEHVGGEEVVERLAANDETGVTVGTEHDRRTGDLVVVRAHRVAVRAGDRHREQIADPGVDRQLRVERQHVTRLAVLADQARRQATWVVDRTREERLVTGPVEHRPGIVAHSAVDGDVGAHVGDVFDRADRVHGHGRRRDDGPTRLDADTRSDAERLDRRRAARCPTG